MLERLSTREGWFALLLLFLLYFTVTLSLQAAQWTSGLHILFPIYLLAFLIGLFFAKTALSPLLMHPLALSIGTFDIVYQTLELTHSHKWEEQLAELIIRLIKWYRQLASSETSADTLPFVMLIAILIWLITYSGVWYFYRERNIWGVLLPSGVTILINTYYANGSLTSLLLIYLIIAFLLIIRTNLLEQEERWQENDIFYSTDIQLDFYREGALFALAVLTLAWLLPSAISKAEVNPIYAKLSQPWNEAQQEWNRLFSSLNYRGSSMPGTSFGTSMSFHGPLNRTEELIMKVTTTNETGGAESRSPDYSPEAHYWRAVVLDEYTSAGWAIYQRTLGQKIPANQPFTDAWENTEQTQKSGRTLMNQEFTIYSPAGILLFAAAEPIKVNIDSQLLLGGPLAAQHIESPESLTQLYAQEALYQGQSYIALSAISTIDEQSLREAGNKYPPELSAHYTALPVTLPARVTAKAATLVRDTESAYDAAKKIEAYLRTIPYNEFITGPQPGEDGVDYFLFREKAGYCDYYASAMAVMLRSQGIPARIAQGYSQGKAIAENQYEVRQMNAHTWTEVYFPSYGWVEFEPTAALTVIERPLTSRKGAEDEKPQQESNREEFQAEQELPGQNERLSGQATPTEQIKLFVDPRWFYIVFAGLTVLASIGTLGGLLIWQRWRHLGVIERLYDQILLLGRVLGKPIDLTTTPAEYAKRLTNETSPIAQSLEFLIYCYYRVRYGTRPLLTKEIAEAEGATAQIRSGLLRQFFRRGKGLDN